MKIFVYLLLMTLGLLAETPLSRTELLQQLQNLTANSAPVLPDETFYQSLDQALTSRPDPELLRALLHYLAVHGSEKETRAARILGKTFLAHTESFLSTYKSLPALQQLKTFPFLEFGWKKAKEHLNKSLPTVRAKQRQFDRLHGYMINVRPEPLPPSPPQE